MGIVNESFCDICGNLRSKAEFGYLCPVVFQSGTPGEEDHFILANAFCIECYDREIKSIVDEKLTPILEDIGNRKFEPRVACGINYLV